MNCLDFEKKYLKDVLFKKIEKKISSVKSAVFIEYGGKMLMCLNGVCSEVGNELHGELYHCILLDLSGAAVIIRRDDDGNVLYCTC